VIDGTRGLALSVAIDYERCPRVEVLVHVLVWFTKLFVSGLVAELISRQLLNSVVFFLFCSLCFPLLAPYLLVLSQPRKRQEHDKPHLP
jgi:hypothetical protein